MIDTTLSRKIHDAYRKELLERQRINSSTFDKVILSLSTAIIGISTSFINNIIELGEAQSIILLKLSWASFSLVIISTVLSFLVSQKALDRQLEYAQKYYLEEKNEFGTKKSLWSRFTDILNLISGIAFIAATILLIVFVTQNI